MDYAPTPVAGSQDGPKPIFKFRTPLLGRFTLGLFSLGLLSYRTNEQKWTLSGWINTILLICQRKKRIQVFVWNEQQPDANLARWWTWELRWPSPWPSRPLAGSSASKTWPTWWRIRSGCNPGWDLSRPRSAGWSCWSSGRCSTEVGEDLFVLEKVKLG